MPASGDRDRAGLPGPAPLHGRLGRGHDPELARALVQDDRARLVAALVTLVGALSALLLA